MEAGHVIGAGAGEAEAVKGVEVGVGVGVAESEVALCEMLVRSRLALEDLGGRVL